MSQYYYNPFGDNRDMNEEKRQQFELTIEKQKQKKELRLISFTIGLAIMGYLFIQMFAGSILALFGYRSLYLNDSVFQYAFNIVGVSFLSVALPFGIMALCNKRHYSSGVVPNQRISFGKCAMWVCFGMSICILSNYAVSIFVFIFKEVFKLELTQGELLNPDSVFSCVLEIIGIAVIPAICEEFAMRCCCLQLLKKYGKGFAVFAVSIVFGLLHGNVIQFVFAFLIGLVLGLMTIKTGSIVPAILVHAFNNGMSAVQSVTTYAVGEDIAEKAVIIIYIFWLASGALSGFCLLFKGGFKIEKSKKSLLTLGEKFSAFLFPGMVVPFIILIVLTLTTIKPV